MARLIRMGSPLLSLVILTTLLTSSHLSGIPTRICGTCGVSSPCSAGQTCIEGFCQTCRHGEVCPAGTSNNLPYLLRNVVPRGSVSLDRVTKEVCPEGYNCDPGAGTKAKCPSLGMYCPAGTAVPSPTTAGEYCDPGHYCPTTAQKITCPAGHYCRQLVTKPKPCRSCHCNPCLSTFFA